MKKLLNSVKLDATPIRIRVLEILVNKSSSEFTYGEIQAQIKKEKLSVSNEAVTATLRLFKARNLIREVPVLESIKPGHRRGRPETKFRFQQNLRRMIRTMKKDEEFMAMDDTDFKILLMLIRRSEEFSKLEFADQKVLVWFLTHSSNRVKSWIGYLAEDYTDRRCTPISRIKLYGEIKDLL